MRHLNSFILVLGMVILAVSCYKVPKEGALSELMEFSLSQVEVTLGRVHILGEGHGLKINVAGTTIPFRFEVERVIQLDDAGKEGSDVTAVFKKKLPMKQWTGQFTGQEKTRAELRAIQTSVEYPVLSFSNANELIFNAGNNEIAPGKYRIVVRVSNSSGSLVLKDDLVLKVNAYAPTFQQIFAPTAGIDGVTSCLVEMVKTGEGNSLEVTVIEKDGTIIPLDSLTASSAVNSFNNIFNFGKVSEAGKTTYDAEYPIPHTPSFIYYPYTASRTQRVVYTRNITQLNANDEPQRVLKYGFNFYFGIFEKGDWKLTVRLK